MISCASFTAFVLVTMLGGRAAEELIFDTVTTGAANDIEKATQLARAMITQYGMSEKFGLMGLARNQDMYLTGRTVMDCGDETAAEVDREVMSILKSSYEEAKRILSENLEALHKIADYLIKKETITGKEFMEILRRVQRGEEEPKIEASAEVLKDETSDESSSDRADMDKSASDNDGHPKKPSDEEEKKEPQKKNFEDITAELHIDTGMDSGSRN